MKANIQYYRIWYTAIVLLFISITSLSSDIQAQPINNVPCNAIHIDCGDYYFNSTANATVSMDNPDCTNGSRKDLFYSFTAIPGYAYTITVNGDNYDGVLVLYSGTCNNLVEEACADDGLQDGIAETILFEIEPGQPSQEIIIRTYDWQSNGGFFDLDVFCTAPNSSRCNSINLECNETINAQTGGVSNNGYNSDCTNSLSDVLYFEFDYEPNLDYTIILEGDNSFQGVIELFEGYSCTFLDYIDCVNSSSNGFLSVDVPPTTANKIYITIFDDVFDYGEDIEITLTCTASNQTPNNPFPLLCGQAISSTTYNAYASEMDDPSCAVGSGFDTFYEFDAFPGSTYQVSVNGSNYDGVLVAYSFTDNQLNEIDCSDEGIGNGITEQISITVAEHTPILIRAYDWAGFGDYSIYLDCIPDNDSPCEAISIQCNETLYSSTTGASPTPLSLENCSFGNLPDVFYSFEAVANTTYNILVSGDFFDAVIYAYTGQCGQLDIVDCVDDNENDGAAEHMTLVFPQDETVFIRTVDYYPDGGEFQIELTCSPPNDNPCQALPISCGETLNGTNEEATISEIPNATCSGSQEDVFYTFVAMPGFSYEIEVDGLISENNPIQGYDAVLGVYVGTCNNMIQLDCVDHFIYDEGGLPETFTFEVENITTVFIRTFDYYPTQGDFEISLNCTPIQSDATLNVNIEWDDCESRNVDFHFYQPGTGNLISSVSTLTGNGSIAVPNIPAGVFDIYMKIDGYLQTVFNSINLENGSINIYPALPPAGDFNGDNGINISDFSIFNAAFGSSSGDINYNALADMNCDGGINILDFSIFNANFGLSGDQP